MRCTHVQFKVRRKRESTRINARQDHEYSYEIVRVSALTNQIAYFENSILKCIDSVIGKSNLKFEISYIILRKTILFLTSMFSLLLTSFILPLMNDYAAMHYLTFCSFHRIEQNICLVGTSINKGCAVYYFSVVMHGLRIIRYL